MNGSVSRRIFVGSLAGAGVGALGATSLDLSLAAQPTAAASPVVREIRRQIKEAFGKMQNGQSGGARQAATALRVYASTVNDNQLQAALRRANRQQLLLTDMNHGELARQAEELGINPSRLPPHSVDRVGREAALDRLLTEGLSPLMLRVADFIDEVGDKMERVEHSGGPVALQVALRQPIPDQKDCGNCEREKQEVDNALQVATVICAVSILFPVFAELCAAASATYIAYYAAYAICVAILAFCEAYYH